MLRTMVSIYHEYREKAIRCRQQALDAAQHDDALAARALKAEAQQFDRAAEETIPHIPQWQWETWNNDQEHCR